MTQIEKEHPGISAIAFADDMVLRGQIDATVMGDIIYMFEEYGLNINSDKTKTLFYNNVSYNIKQQKTFKYLRINVRANDKSYDKLGSEDRIK